MHVFMQFEQFCSKDFRDTSNLILNQSKLGPITLYLCLKMNIQIRRSRNLNSICKIAHLKFLKVKFKFERRIIILNHRTVFIIASKIS